MAKLYITVSLLLISGSVFSQIIRPLKEIPWTWVSGDKTANGKGVYDEPGFGKNNMPSSRSEAASFYDADNRLWLFGGDGGKQDFLNDLWYYDQLRDEWFWAGGTRASGVPGIYGEKMVPGPQNMPGGRAGSVTWSGKDGALYIFGGYGVDGKENIGMLNDLWRYEPGKGWAWISGDEVVNEAPVYGEKGVASKKNKPNGRRGAVSWTDKNGNFWMFGGTGYFKGKAGKMNDLWMFDPKTALWTWKDGSDKPDQFGFYNYQRYPGDPGGRASATAWVDNKGLFWMFGGVGYGAYESEGLLNDLWSYDPEKEGWIWVNGGSNVNSAGNYNLIGRESENSFPGARGGAVSWCDKNNIAWLFGGNGFNSKGEQVTLNDLWKYDAERRMWVWVSGSNTGNEPGSYGTLKKAHVDNTPGTRYYAIAWKDTEDRKWLFGGLGYSEKPTGHLNDLWLIGNLPDKPKFSCPGSKQVNVTDTACGAVVNDIDAVITKGVPYTSTLKGATTGSFDGTASGTYFAIGTTEVLYKVMSNIDLQCTFTVTVKDTGPPVPLISKLEPVYASCSIKDIKIPEAVDACGSHIKATTKDPLVYDTPGEYSITWTYRDNSGNTSSQVQDVIVSVPTANMKPALERLPDIDETCSVVVKEAPKAFAGCNTIIEATTTSPLKYNKPGKYQIKWEYTYRDSIAVQYQTVIVRAPSQLFPSKKILQDIVSDCSVTIKDIPTAADMCGNTTKATTKDPLSYSKPGSYEVKWVYNDKYGNALTQTQKVIVNDAAGKLAPAVASLQDIKGNCSVTVKEKPKATAGCSAIVEATTSDPLSYAKAGSYTITWTYKYGDEVVSQKQKVVVETSDKPVPVSEALPDIKESCSVNVTNIPLATDGCGGIIKATTGDPLVYTTPGTYIIHWSYRNGKGNTITQQQKVVVEKPEHPITPLAASLPVLEAECLVRAQLAPKAVHTCLGVITAATMDPLVYDEPGEYTINWKFTGNKDTLTVQQKVVVKPRPESYKVYPNPAENEFSVLFSSCTVDKVYQLVIYDVVGRVVERMDATANRLTRFGMKYPGGMYYLHFMEGKERKLIPLMKR